ncbi:MAG: DUF393 domain-containing protein [Sphingomonadales bacterium]|nr:DUF393 domain-containing protein [Sphingomonadales bacterium]
MKNSLPDSIPDLLVVFDGQCILCNRTLQFYLERVAKAEKKDCQNNTGVNGYYTAAQSPWAQRHLPNHILQEAHQAIQTHHNKHWLSGPPALWPLIARMKNPWRLLIILSFLPRPLTRALYRFIARRRYRWFGTQASCSLFELPPGHQLLHH